MGSGFSRTLRLGFLGSSDGFERRRTCCSRPSAVFRQARCPSTCSAPHASYHGDDSYRQQLEPLLGRDGVRAARRDPARADRPGARVDRRSGRALVWPENAPLVIQEAFLAGVPVVASRIGGIPEMVADGRNGLLFAAGDVDDLARTLTRLLDEPGLLDALRAGIPAVRSIEEDVRFARSLYQHLQPQSTQRTQSQGFCALRSLRLM